MNIQKKLFNLQKRYEEIETTNLSLSSRLSELYILYNLTHILTTTFDLNKIFRNIFQLFHDSLSIDFSSLIFIDSYAKKLNLALNYGSSKQGGKNIILPNKKIHEAILKTKSYRSKTIVSLSEIINQKKEAISLPMQLLGFPLVISNQTIVGSLSFFRKGDTRFSREEIDFYQRIIQEVSNILDKIYLFYQTKEDTFRDHLTGVYNRRYFNQRLLMEIKRAERYKRDISILMIDIDNFKQVNDQFGHVTGDDVLKKLVDILRENLRDSDILVRYGGEEFVALLPETNSENAYIASEKLRAAVELILTAPIENKTNGKSITISIGVSSYPASADSSDSLIRLADERLYLAKNKGKNCTVFQS